MGLELLTRRELEVINRRTHRYPLHIAEKDYLLSVVCAIIAQSGLRGKLVFKGGTALHHCYLPNLRFSEDLDFTYYPRSRDSLPEEVLGELASLFNEHDFLEVRKSFVSDFTIKIDRLTFTGPLGQPNWLKIEVDMEQAVVLPPGETEYANVWRVETGMLTMDIREIFAEKVRAIDERARYRDFYDLFMMTRRFEIDLPEVSGIVSEKEKRKPFSREAIMANWETACSEREADGHRIFYLEDAAEPDVEGMLLNILEAMRL
jgi:uncharacterized protein